MLRANRDDAMTTMAITIAMASRNKRAEWPLGFGIVPPDRFITKKKGFR